jgi:hypothetical protein
MGAGTTGLVSLRFSPKLWDWAGPPWVEAITFQLVLCSWYSVYSALVSWITLRFA